MGQFQDFAMAYVSEVVDGHQIAKTIPRKLECRIHHCNVPEVTRIGKVTKKTGGDIVLTRAHVK